MRPKKPLPPPVDPLPEDRPNADGAMTLKEAAKFLGHGKSWLNEEAKAGRIVSFLYGGRRLFSRRDLERQLDKARAKATA
jgi:excisionase family DNA binding protein